MKRYWRSGLCGILVGLTLYTTAAASNQSEISVKINGRPVVFEEEVKVVDGRTYLPFRGVFQALGIEDSAITFDSDTRMVCAESEDLTVSMVIGEKWMRVTRDGKTQILHIDAPAFIDPVLGRTYVPARFVAEAAQYRLGWDGGNRVVLLDDVDAVLEGNQETYTILQAYLDFVQRYRTENYQSKGEYAAEVTMGDDRISLKGNYSMLSDQSGLFELEMPLNLEADISDASLSGLLPEEPYLYGWGKRKENIHYIRIDDRIQREKETEQGWIVLDMEAMTEDSYPELAADYIRWINPDFWGEKEQAAQEYIEYLLYDTVQRDYSVSAPDVLNRINRLLGDSAFRLEKGGYVNELEQGSAEGKIHFQFREETIIGVEFYILEQPTRTQPGVELYTAVNGNEWEIELTLVETMDELTHISMSGTMEETRKKPVGYLP